MKGITKDRIYGIIFAVLVVPCALLVQWTTGLWSWADQFIMAHRPDYGAPQVNIGLGAVREVLCFSVPIGVSLLLCWGLTTLLYRRFVRPLGR